MATERGTPLESAVLSRSRARERDRATRIRLSRLEMAISQTARSCSRRRRSNLEDLGFFAVQELVELFDLGIGELLHLVLKAAEVIL